jgi:hypothetical protein
VRQRLALEAVVDRVSEDGLLSDLGVFGDDGELPRLQASAAAADWEIVTDSERADHRRPVRCSLGLDTFEYDDPPSLTTGVRTGKWIAIKSSA